MFFFLRQNLFADLGMLDIVGHTDETSRFNWLKGVRFDRPVPRETLLLDDRGGANFPDYFDSTIPVMSLRMVAALSSFGVANLDTYPVLLRNNATGVERDDYVAVNLIGSVDAVDLANSTYRSRFGAPYFTGPVAIDPTAAGDRTAFRLQRGPAFIVLAAPLAAHLAAAGLAAVLLQPTTAYQGT